MLTSSNPLCNIQVICVAVLSVILGMTFSGCVKRDRRPPESRTPAYWSPQAARININTATPNELETLPGIGKALAARIIEHREKYGRFRRPEHLIIVRGISDGRFRALRESITVE